MINKLAKEIHKWAKKKGWWDTERNTGEIFANFHSEISEAWEEWRNGKSPTLTYYGDVPNKPEGIPIELADCIIRILDYCAYYEIDIEKAIKVKMEYNKTRSIRHGGKKA